MAVAGTSLTAPGGPAAPDAAYERVFMRLWAEKHVNTETGKPLDFGERPWLKEIWDDPHPRTVGEKSAQMGWTMLAITKACHRAGVHGETVIYTMPGKDDARDLVSGRIDKIIDQSAELRRLAGRGVKFGRRKPSDNTELKHMGQGVIYFRGTKGATGALAVPAQCLIHDEVDASNQEALDTYDSRLENVDPPSARQKHQFSTPTYPGVGIDALYEKSTQHSWLIRCERCGWEGPPAYWDMTDGHLPYLKCPDTACGAPLNPLTGRFVARHPDRDVHGYHISRLLTCTPQRPDRMLAIHERRHNVEYEYLFDNMVLGEPSKKGTTEVDTEGVKAVAWKVGHSSAEGATLFGGAHFMGVDQGDTLTVMVGLVDWQSPGQVRVVYRNRLRDPERGSGAWTDVARLMESFQVKMCVVDANPNSASAHDLAKDRRFKGRVLCCYYGEGMRTEIVEASDVRKRADATQAGGTRQGSDIDATERVDITVDRTQSLDRTAADIKSGVFQYPDRPDDPENREMLQHFAHNIRGPEKAADGNIIYRWVRRGGANDYFHANNYLRVAIEEGMRLARPSTAVGSQFTITGVSTPKK